METLGPQVIYLHTLRFICGKGRRKMTRIILYIWQLPQNILGLIVKSVTRAEKGFAGYYYWRFKSGLSLGNYIFINEKARVTTAKHEEGHQKQSQKLGPLYLLVIGLPSFVWTCLKTIGLFKKTSYYSFYTERWADKLTGIERGGDNA